MICTCRGCVSEVLYLQILTSVSQPMTVCSSVTTLREVTTVHVINILKQTPLTGESVKVRDGYSTHILRSHLLGIYICKQSCNTVCSKGNDRRAMNDFLRQWKTEQWGTRTSISALCLV